MTEAEKHGSHWASLRKFIERLALQELFYIGLKLDVWRVIAN